MLEAAEGGSGAGLALEVQPGREQRARMEKLRQGFARGEKLDPRLQWLNMPELIDIGVTEFERLTVGARGGSDAWMKTYYTPEIVKCDVSLLGVEWPGDFSATTRFRVDAQHQFDQAGLMFHIDDDHWVKAGLEYVDGRMRASVVSTDGYSDWTTHGFRSVTSNATVTIHRKGQQIFVDFGEEEPADVAGAAIANWWTNLFHTNTRVVKPQRFCRLAEIRTPASAPTPRVGLYAASPTKQGGTACFDYLIVTEFIRKSAESHAQLLRSARYKK